MAETANKINLSDEQLVSYLDGGIGSGERAEVERLAAADPELKLRLKLLDRGDRRFKEAFRSLLRQAPTEKLHASLASARAKTRSKSALEDSSRYLSIAIAASFMLAIIVGGVIAGYFVGTRSAIVEIGGSEQENAPPKTRDWRQALADYHALLSRETFVLLPPAVNDQNKALDRAGRYLGLNLTFAHIKDATLDFQTIQVLKLRSMPLVHLAYLTKNGIPLSFCIIKSAESARQPVLEQYGDMKIVHWVTGGIGFALIGGSPEAELKALAKRMQRRFL